MSDDVDRDLLLLKFLEAANDVEFDTDGELTFYHSWVGPFTEQEMTYLTDLWVTRAHEVEEPPPPPMFTLHAVIVINGMVGIDQTCRITCHLFLEDPWKFLLEVRDKVTQLAAWHALDLGENWCNVEWIGQP